jgi:hypothetical protein
MLLSQVFSPFVYAVSGEEVPVDEVVTETVVVEESIVLEPIEDEKIIEEDNSKEIGDTGEEIID